MRPPAHFLRPLLAPGGAGAVLLNDRTGRVVAKRVEIAADSKTRTRGLLGRQGLDPDATLVIAPCNAVHTFFMRFTIDVVFAGRDGRILKICPRVRPWRIAFAVRAFAALEFAAGAVERSGLAVGDQLVAATR